MSNSSQNFFKMHSLGNHFMVIDGVTRNFEADPARIAAWGDANTGIGFDQLLVIAPPTEPEADFRYQIFNADGSEAQQCGNGTRCVALLVKRLGLSPRDTLRWQSLAGTIVTEAVSADQFATTMTVPVLEPAAIPFDPAHASAGARPGTHTLDSAAGDFELMPVSMGNPHGVLFTDNLRDLDVATIGATLTDHPAFPERANIGFCQVVDRQFVRLRVFERGVGETQACGSGACAAVVAARLQDRVDERVKVSLPGGKLRIAWCGQEDTVKMAGPATLVFEGTIAL